MVRIVHGGSLPGHTQFTQLSDTLVYKLSEAGCYSCSTREHRKSAFAISGLKIVPGDCFAKSHQDLPLCSRHNHYDRLK